MELAVKREGLILSYLTKQQQQQPKSSGDQAPKLIRTKIAGNHPCDPKGFNLSSKLGLPCCLNEITVVMTMGWKEEMDEETKEEEEEEEERGC